MELWADKRYQASNMRKPRRYQRLLRMRLVKMRWISLVIGLGLCLALIWLPATGHPLPKVSQPGQIVASDWQTPDQQGRVLYEAGRFTEAEILLQQALQNYRQQGDRLQQALTLSNLALVYQQLGQWQAANQAIVEGIRLLTQTTSLDPANSQVLAQALVIRGRLQLRQGQAESALASWQEAAAVYARLEDWEGTAQSRLNQAQALQALGLYRRAIDLLTDLSTELSNELGANSPAQPSEQQFRLKVAVLRSLGDALQVSGDLSASRRYLEQALTAVTNQPQPVFLADLYLSLANLTRVEATTQLSLSNLTPDRAIQVLTRSETPSTLAAASLKQRQMTAAQQFVQQFETALQQYQQAADQAVLPATRIQAQLGQLSTLIELQRWSEANSLIAILRPQFTTAPLDHNRLYQQINLGISWLKLEQAQVAGVNSNRSTAADIQQLLRQAAVQAAAFGDRRTESFALGSLGEVDAWMQAETTATQVTEQALMLSQAIGAADLSYRWQWQLGRLLKQKGDRAGAIAAYTEAVRSLQALRNDLVAINREIQFSFRAQVEPVYRELVDLLLSANSSQTTMNQLVQAREVIEGLQIAELDNFFREACLEAQFEIEQVIDREQLAAAVLYTIVLPDRLELILKLPEQALKHYTTQVPSSTLESTVDELVSELKRPYLSQKARTLSKQVYDWLIEPVNQSLNQTNHFQQNKIETLVFLLDGALRNLPVAALYDGEQFLIQKYGVALAPGLQLADPKPLQERQFRVLAAGLSEARADFAPLNFVEQEIQQIQAELPSRVLFNQTFTPENLQQQLDNSTFSIIHIATHGQFSSNAADTFILAWDRPINVNELSDLLQMQEVNQPQPIELLVLSACRTAVGDQRASLGMAGVAVRAGARSTIASLWNLDDDSGAVLMEQFYRALAQPVSKAEALRHAQIALLENPRYAAPRFWAPYVLLGNWL